MESIKCQTPNCTEKAHYYLMTDNQYACIGCKEHKMSINKHSSQTVIKLISSHQAYAALLDGKILLENFERFLEGFGNDSNKEELKGWCDKMNEDLVDLNWKI